MRIALRHVVLCAVLAGATLADSNGGAKVGAKVTWKKKKGGAKVGAMEKMTSCYKRKKQEKTGTHVESADRMACHRDAKETYGNGMDGDTKNFARIAKADARDKMMDFMMKNMKSCRDEEGKDAKTCRDRAESVYEEAGGDPKQRKVEFKQGIQDKVGAKLEECVSVKDAACRGEVKELMKKLGGDSKRFNRVKQDAVRDKIALLMEDCGENRADKTETSDAADDKEARFAACKVEGKAMFVKLTGKTGTDSNTEKDFKKQMRKGAGARGAKSKNACLALVARDSKETDQADYVDACVNAAKESHANAGGNAASFWYDCKKASLEDAVLHFKTCMDGDAIRTDGSVATEDDCSGKAKTYFKETLKGTEGDFSGEDFKRMKDNWDRKVSSKPSNKVDVRFSFRNGILGTKVLGDVLDSMDEIENIIKDGLGKVDCHDPENPNGISSRIDIVCRVEVKTAELAAKVADDAAAKQNLLDAVLEEINPSARRALRRALTEDSKSIDASQVQIDTPIECTEGSCDEGDECVFETTVTGRRRLLFASEEHDDEHDGMVGTCRPIPESV